MLVVADTSPLHYLVLIQHDSLLPALYKRVMIPPAVLAALQQPRTPPMVRAWVPKAKWRFHALAIPSPCICSMLGRTSFFHPTYP